MFLKTEFEGRKRIFSPRHHVKTRTGDHPASYPLGAGDSPGPPPSSTRFKNAWCRTSIPPYGFMERYLIKQRIRLHDT